MALTFRVSMGQNYGKYHEGMLSGSPAANLATTGPKKLKYRHN
ncbi:hypothetical protein [Bacillus horti]|uniref:Uncharacterized protein n=1 Tax=Caldalkalibacillus horti TaxID=77523 RepID=A0ABT9VYR8_9BACI|nr:hypothetical protein [Bacillus horti]